MTNEITQFIEEFPLAPREVYDRAMIQVDLISRMEELLEIQGYDDSVVHRDIKLDVPDDVYEPPDFEVGSTIEFPLIVSENIDSPPHLAFIDDPYVGPSPLDADYQLYQDMRVCHETANPRITLLLTPYDLLTFDGLGSPFGESEIRPIEYYPLHQSELDQTTIQDLIDELQPPDFLR